MLYAIINPKASIVEQTSPFDYDIILCEYMSASAQPYELGLNETRFQVNFIAKNEPAKENEPAVPEYSVIHTDYVMLTSEQLSAWGTDDKDALVAIAQYYNTNITGYVE